MCIWVVTSECRISDSDRARAVMISAAARSRSPRPSPQPSGRRRTGPCMDSDYDRTRVLEVIPNSNNMHVAKRRKRYYKARSENE